MFCVCAAEHGVHARQDRCSAVLSPVQGLHCLCPRATQRCILRRCCRCRCCFLPTPQSHTRDDSAGVRVAPAATSSCLPRRRRRFRATRSGGSIAAAAPVRPGRAPLSPCRPSVRSARRGACVRGRHSSVPATATATGTATATVERGQRAARQCSEVGARSRAWEGGRGGEAGSSRVIIISGGRI